MDKEIKTTQPEATEELQSLREEVKQLEETVKELAHPDTPTSNGHLALLAVVVVALISLLIAAYFVFLRVPKNGGPVSIVPAATTTPAIISTTTATATPVTIEVYKDSKPWYDVSIEYPNIPVVKDFIIGRYDDFAQDTKMLTPKTQAEAKEILGLFSPEVKYLFNSTMTTASSSDTASYIFETYTFTGGAHGGTQVVAVTLDKDGKVIPVDQILKDSYLQKVADIAKPQIIAEKKKRLQSSGMSTGDINSLIQYDEMVTDGTKPTRDNYSVVWIDGDDVVVHFAQYQVGAYVEGMYDVRIKRSLLE